MTVYFHEEDLPGDVLAPGPVAVDTETMGLVTPRDRLCLVQIADGNGDEHLVRFSPGSDFAAPNLRAVLADPARPTIYHFRSEEHTSELQSLMRISNAVF